MTCERRPPRTRSVALREHRPVANAAADSRHHHRTTSPPACRRAFAQCASFQRHRLCFGRVLHPPFVAPCPTLSGPLPPSALLERPTGRFRHVRTPVKVIPLLQRPFRPFSTSAASLSSPPPIFDGRPPRAPLLADFSTWHLAELHPRALRLAASGCNEIQGPALRLSAHKALPPNVLRPSCCPTWRIS